MGNADKINFKPFGKVLLASGSPRRLQLLAEAGFEVKVINNLTVDESYPDTFNAHRVPEFLSKLKAEAYKGYAIDENLPLIAADTVVILNGQIIGKPKNENDAVKMILNLSGNMHEVVTGVTIIKPDQDQITFSETTKVYFNPLPEKFIEWYVEEYKPMDKAGAYGVQEWIGLVGVKKIEGDFYNVMGLPVQSVVTHLFK